MQQDACRLEAARRRDAELAARAEQRQAAQHAAVERQRMETQRLAAAAVRAELTLGCPARLVARAAECGVETVCMDVEHESTRRP